MTKAEVFAQGEENPEELNLIKPTKIETNPFSISVSEVDNTEDSAAPEESKANSISCRFKCQRATSTCCVEDRCTLAEPCCEKAIPADQKCQAEGCPNFKKAFHPANPCCPSANIPILPIAESLNTSSSEEGKDEQLPVAEVFKQRLVNYRKQLNKQLAFADQMEARNQQLAVEFGADIYKNLRKEELRLKVSPSYLQEVQNPKEIKDTSRAFLVEWIIDVHRKFRLVPETLYVTVFLIDRYLSTKMIRKNQLHILGVASLLISTKYEEIYPPELKDLLSVSENKFTRNEVLAMERDILFTLQFDVTTPSAYRFLERYRRLTSVANDPKIFFLAQYIQEIALLDASLLQYNPSEIAAASLILSVKCMKKMHAWNKEMEALTGYSDAHLAPIVEEVKGFALEVNPKFLTTLKYKFSKQEYMEVASIALKF